MLQTQPVASQLLIRLKLEPSPEIDVPLKLDGLRQQGGHLEVKLGHFRFGLNLDQVLHVSGEPEREEPHPAAQVVDEAVDGVASQDHDQAAGDFETEMIRVLGNSEVLTRGSLQLFVVLACH